MKTKFLIVAAAFMVFTYAANAQVVRFGLKGGVNFSTINTEGTAFDYASRTGFNAGAIAHIHLSKNWALQPELVYSLQGGKSNLPAGGTQSINLNYLNVPVLLQYMFNNGFRLQTGPQAGFLIGANAKTSGQNSSIDVSGTYNSTDFSWSFGTGYLSSIGLGIDARYNLGLSDAYKPGTGKQKNNVLQVGLFYMFGHKSK